MTFTEKKKYLSFILHNTQFNSIMSIISLLDVTECGRWNCKLRTSAATFMSQTSSNHMKLVPWPATTGTRRRLIGHFGDEAEQEIDMQRTNVQRPHNVIMSTSSKLSEECFQHLALFMALGIEAAVRSQGSPTRYRRGFARYSHSVCSLHVATHIDTETVCDRVKSSLLVHWPGFNSATVNGEIE